MAEATKTENYNAPSGLSSVQTLALGAGVIGLIATVAGAFIGGSVEMALRAYLLGFCYWAGIAIGCLGILILQHITGGSWGVVIRRLLEAGAKTLPIVAVLFIPIALFVGQIYEWAHYEELGKVGSGADKILDHKYPYLNMVFWWIRSAVYFAVWIAMAYLLTSWSKKQDETGDWKLTSIASRFSGPALVFFFLTVSFAAIDWAMSLDPHWFSTIYGLLFAIGWALSALSFVVALLAWMAGRAPLNNVLTSAHFHDLGKIMLALVMIWAYFNFSQLVIIYAANIPEETPWYLRRMEGGWGIIGLVLILLHFAFPFLLLLSQDLKKRFHYLAYLAVFILLMRLVDLFYLIKPNPMIEGGYGATKSFLGSFSWMDVVAPIGVGGIWLFFFFYFLKQRPVFPYNDPYAENAIAHGREHH
jgi:hypothetical protein